MKRCLIGFDGYMDELYRMVSGRVGEHISCFRSMKQFGAYLSEGGRRSADVQILPVSVHYGGNGPLMAGAMASLGMETTCVGLFDGCRGLTEALEERVSCISIGHCNRCIAMELADGKLMFGELSGGEMTWQDFTARMDEKELRSLLGQCDLIGIVNWSAFFHMNDILVQLEKMIREEGGSRILFFDPADISARSDGDVQEFAGLLQDFGMRHRVILGLNQKEAVLFGKKAFGEEMSAGQAAGRLSKLIPGSTVVVHDSRGAVCWHGTDCFWDSVEPIENPQVMTGAGDHFNAGFCCAVLNGDSLQQALKAGNRAAGYYIRYGRDLEA